MLEIADVTEDVFAKPAQPHQKELRGFTFD
jgi:hypothetical protein